MRVLFCGTALILFYFFLHLIIWRIRLPERGIKVLGQIFFWVLISGILFLWIAPFVIQSFRQITPGEYFQICLFFTSLALSYAVTYSAIEADSPSIAMMMKAAGAGTEGLNDKEFEQMMTDEILIKPRIRDLLIDKMIYLERNEYKLTFRGLLFVSIFILYRRLLNLPKGG